MRIIACRTLGMPQRQKAQKNLTKISDRQNVQRERNVMKKPQRNLEARFWEAEKTLQKYKVGVH